MDKSSLKRAKNSNRVRKIKNTMTARGVYKRHFKLTKNEDFNMSIAGELLNKINLHNVDDIEDRKDEIDEDEIDEEQINETPPKPKSMKPGAKYQLQGKGQYAKWVKVGGPKDPHKVKAGKSAARGISKGDRSRAAKLAIRSKKSRGTL
jgi:hypothetical protein